jgi:serine/threonine protein kinase
MNAERWAQIDRLLDEALALPPKSRAGFLHRAAGGDEELRCEVEALLEAHDRAESRFLDLPALEVAARGMAEQRAASLVGSEFGAYQILAALGVGGMGEVYLAQDRRLKRKLALKLLPPQYTSDPTRIKRFEREALAASALNHPNIITIYEIGQVAGRHFIAAEFIEGRTLREIVSQGRVAMKDAVEIAIQICSALSAAHEAGIIHRDIKPENVMRRLDGYVKVLDFGLVKLIERRKSSGSTNASDGDLARTNPGTVLGTVRYMAPEQALGQEVDHRSDIFSLGVLLYELVTGVSPFKGDSTAAMLDAIVHYQPLPITEVCRDLSLELERIISRSLEKDRELRYQTAVDFRAELKRLQREMDSAEMASAKQQTALDIASGKRKRWGRPLAGAAIVVATMIAATLGWRYLNSEAKPPGTNWNNARFTQITGLPGRESNASISPDGHTVIYSRLVNGQWDIFSQRIGGSAAINLSNHPAADGDVAFSPDGERIAFFSSRDGGGIFIMGAAGENVRRLTHEGRDPDWSPDGREVVYSTLFGGNIFSRIVVGGQLWVVNADTGAKRRIATGPTAPDAVQPKWSPHGYRIAYWGVRDNTQRDIWTIPVAGGEPVPVTNDAHEDGSPVWSPEGKYLYYSSNRNGRLGIWRVAIDELSGKTLGEPELVPTQSSYSHELSISADGRRLVYTARSEMANIFRVAFDAKRGVVAGSPVQVTFAAGRALNFSVSPDGQSVAYYTYGDPQFDIFVSKVDGSSTQQVTNDEPRDWSPRWSPDGSRLAFFSNRTGKYEIWTVSPDGSDRRQLTFSRPDQPGFVLPAWAPGGTRILFSLRRGPGFIMDVTRPWGEQTLFEFPPTPDHNGEKTWFTAYNWSHDGGKIIGSIEKAYQTLPGMVAYDLASQQYEQITKEGATGFWLRDNRRLVYQLNGKIYLVDSKTKTPRELLSIPNLSLDDPNLSPDEKWLFYSATSIEEDLWMITLSGQKN